MNSEANPFDGRVNYNADNEIERRLEEHFERYRMSAISILKHFPVYVRRVHLKRFLAHYEIFLRTINLPGDIVELGVFHGVSLLSWANFLEIRNMGDRHKKVIGFDNFSGFASLDEKDGKEDVRVGKVPGGFNPGSFEDALRDAIAIFDADRFIPYKERIHLVKGDIEKTVPAYVRDNPGMRISLLHFDADLYRPTRTALECLWPLVVPGGVVLFDEYGIPPWEGESRAVDEYFKGQPIRLRRFDWVSNPGAYIVKGE